jgi:hypothetical protein
MAFSSCSTSVAVSYEPALGNRVGDRGNGRCSDEWSGARVPTPTERFQKDREAIHVSV